MPARTPEECDTLFASHLTSGNLEELLALYEPEATLVQQNAPPVCGTVEIRKRLAAFVAIRPKFTANVVKVIEADETLAVLYNDWTLTTKDAGTLNGKAIEIVRRQPDGSWLFVVDDPYGRT